MVADTRAVKGEGGGSTLLPRGCSRGGEDDEEEVEEDEWDAFRIGGVRTRRM